MRHVTQNYCHNFPIVGLQLEDQRSRSVPFSKCDIAESDRSTNSPAFHIERFRDSLINFKRNAAYSEIKTNQYILDLNFKKIKKLCPDYRRIAPASDTIEEKLSMDSDSENECANADPRGSIGKLGSSNNTIDKSYRFKKFINDIEQSPASIKEFK